MWIGFLFISPNPNGVFLYSKVCAYFCLQCCWLGVRKSIWPEKMSDDVQMPLPPYHLMLHLSPEWFTFLLLVVGFCPRYVFMPEAL